MKVEAIMYIADKKINSLMRSCDLNPEYKVFINSTQNVSYETTTKVDADYFMNLIEKSKKEGLDFWIPCIKYNGAMFVSPEIKEISDGEKCMFVRNN
jgi:hypothetical protein